MDETRVVLEAGRQWLRELADFFEANAGRETMTSMEDSIVIARNLREIAGEAAPVVPEDLEAELEAWYQQVGQGNV
jgi:hypothetical protein